MYRRILVAVDGSDTSHAALKEAISLGKEQRSTLHLVHVVDLTIAYTDIESPYAREYRDELRATGEKIIADCSKVVRQAEVEFDTRIVDIESLGQHTYDAIEDEAKRWSADLIVIGTHGRRGFRRLLLGSVAEGVIRVASKPVLLIRGA